MSEHDFVKIMQKINYRAEITKSQPLNGRGIEIRSETIITCPPQVNFLDRNYNLAKWKNAQENGTFDASITSNDINQSYGTRNETQWSSFVVNSRNYRTKLSLVKANKPYSKLLESVS